MPFLDWVNKNQAKEATHEVPYHLLNLEQTFGDQRDAGRNMLIQGDNLLALKALVPFYAGQVKCIFIDPPYNTKSAFEHYDDNLEHSQWLSMMYPRLVLLRELLAEDGSIWVSLDDNEAHYLKVMMDEVFSRRCFVTNVIWEKADSPRNSARQFSADHDHILVYSRAPDWTPRKLPRTEAANSIYSNPDDDPRGPWIPGDPYANKPYSKGLYTVTGPSGRAFSPPPGRFWRIAEDKLRDLDLDGRIWWGPTGEARPSIKRYLNEVSDLVPRTLWRRDDVGSNRTSKNEMRALFPNEPSFGTPKPEALIQRVLQIATKEGDLVLDSFLGSGTTAAVAHKMERRYIGIEMGAHAQTHCAPRLQKVVEGEQGGVSEAVGWQGGGGFSFYTLGDAAFDENGRLSPSVRFKTLAAYVWMLETGKPAQQAFESPLIGVHEGKAYFLLYNVTGHCAALFSRLPSRGTIPPQFIREEAAVTRATTSINKWQRRSRQEWQTVFARFAESGLGVEPFCVREGLSESTFRRWRSALGDEAPPAVRPAAQQVPEPTGFVDAGTLKLGGTGRFELRLDLGDGVILHLSRG